MAPLTEQDILLSLPDLSATQGSTFWVAYSGGLDSQVLLSLLQKIIPTTQLRAVHINHGLSPQADDWQAHCQQYCQRSGISFECKTVVIDKSASSLELQARQARYAVFESLLQADDYLLMAHHQDDHMETVLYRLLRGSGPRGLAGIPAQRKIGKGILLRPLLKVSKEALTDYAKTTGLSWVEDSSNKDTNFDRNLLRQDIIPTLKMRWPQVGKSIQRSAELCFESEQLLQELAKIDAGQVLNTPDNIPESSLAIASLTELNKPRQRNVLRYWFQGLAEGYGIPVPGYEELRRIVDELIPAAEDARPLVAWKNAKVNVQVRRFAGKIVVLKDFPAVFDKRVRAINLEEKLELGGNLGAVILEKLTATSDLVATDGVCIEAGDALEIRFQCDEPEAKPIGRKTRSLKKNYQDYCVPPWLRDRIPLLFINGKLVAVADLFVCHGKGAKKGQKNVKINWQKLDIYCGY
ncbi:MAG: tRNA lysidine(34) synthetase TilS [SAR86 cluster bacterium]|uniref:tRNA(Ile)-lysidine synthase n=1 Tax=SAR86 cluster bacterium TaxID=2030880 RepID=A0A2A5CA85_9GAMM|nr:MAG: tRNA lysidine(34) synthetase TilS [SAR86 cluster bacterium]